MKKAVALMLAVLMLLSMVACGGSDTKDTTKASEATTKAAEATTKAAEAETTKAEATEAETEAPLSKYDEFIANAKAKAAETGEYEKVYFSAYCWAGTPAGQDRIVAALNEVAHEEIGLDIEFTMVGYRDYREGIPLSLAAGEDVGWFAGNVIGYTSSINKGFCWDLEEDDLIQNYGPGIAELIGDEFLDACRVGGILYGVCPIKDIAIEWGGFMLPAEYLKAIGYEYVEDPETQEVLGKSWDEITELLYKLRDAYPEISIVTPITSWFSMGCPIDSIGGDSFGVLEDPLNSLEVVNLFGCDTWNRILGMVREWNLNGLFAADAATTPLSSNATIKAGQGMAMLSQVKPGYKSQVSGECGKEMVIFKMGDAIVKASGPSSVIDCLAYNVENPEAHMVCMNFLYTNAEAMQLLCWGQEGKEYQYTGDGHVTFADGIDASNSEWYHTCNWALPNQYLSTPWVGDPLDLGAKTMEFNQTAGRSLAMGFTFDNSDYSGEYTALTNKYSEYSKNLLFGFVDPTEGTAELNKELEVNGLNEYINAKAEALDAWAKSVGKK